MTKISDDFSELSRGLRADFENDYSADFLGGLATDATVLISCWMTEARIGTMQNQKAMFKEILK